MKATFGLVFLLALGGLIAAFALTLEKIERLGGKVAAACDVNILVQCSANLDSWQGSLFGFPNPILGLIGWPIVMTLAVLLIADTLLPRWIMRAFSLGMAFAFGFVLWLMYVSFWQLGTLCPWCIATWLTTIPAAVIIWLEGLKSGIWTGTAKETEVGKRLLFWSPTIVLAIIGIAALVAQWKLDWLVRAFI